MRRAARMAMRTSATESFVETAKAGACYAMTLTRPKALNALTLPMVRDLTAAFAHASEDKSVKCVLLEGAGGKAFCAGGDVKGVWQAARPEGQDDENLADAFFREEYALNAAIGGSPKPQVSVWDGIVMGGGAGLSVHGKYRLASEKAMFAMPETNIGLFPDVGGSHFLSRMPGALGAYIGLTGERLHAADLLYCGLATHYVPSSALPELRPSLTTCTSADDVEAVVTRLGANPPPTEGAFLEARREQIDAAFGFETLEEIMSHLRSREAAGDEFAKATLTTLTRMSPTSMKITLRLIREARAEVSDTPLSSCLAREFRVVQRCVAPPSDFFEGIRAALVDKDRNPKWSPAAVHEVSAEAVDAFFAPLGERELALPRLPGFSAP